jgi:hypothetical protein
MEMYKIRGRHSTVYPVQLPNWSSPDVVKELIKRFGSYLRRELDIMRSSHIWVQSFQARTSKSGHAHSPSLQSVSSAITNVSQHSAESNLDDFPNQVLHLPYNEGKGR